MSGLRAARTFSCAECRRLKLKCNRQWPCTECVRRGVTHLCPSATSRHGPSKREQVAQLQGRVKQLEELLAQTVTSQSPNFRDQGAALCLSPDTRVDLPQDVALIGPSQAQTDSIDSVGHLKRRTGGNSTFFGVTVAEHRLAMATENENEGAADVIKPTNSPSRLSQGWPLYSSTPTPNDLNVDSLISALPSRVDTEVSVDRFWHCTLWRFEPFTRKFLEVVLDDVYTSKSGSSSVHPHRIALVYAVLALSESFKSDTGSSDLASSYHHSTRSALAIGRFLSDVSIASLCAIHLMCGYVLNAGDTLDELYVLVGLGVRLAVSAGFHRDGSWWNIEQPELDDRRRIWWELTQLERVHSYTLGMPITLPTGYDTAKPSNLSPISFLFWKWDLLVLVSSINEKATFGRGQKYTEILAADSEMRAYNSSIPIHLRCRSAPLWRLNTPAGESHQPSLASYGQDPVLGSEGLPPLLALQQLRLAQLYNMSMFHLHRSSFFTALHGEHDPLDGPLAASVLALVVESSGNSLSLLSTLFQTMPMLALFASNSLELFNVLASSAALLIRRPKSLVKEYARRHMDQAMDLMKRIHDEKPSHRLEILLQKSRKLVTEATAVLEAPDVTGPWLSPWNPVPPESVQTPFVQSHGVEHISTIDFDTWLSQILEGDDLP